ncbi:MAG TPA: hypothetical protein VFX23_08120, partial [Limnobacter sp.]|uniref:hypothetical protein n=1 Tax=Limnobacter sp. TaxID=2003368 RepID=UPI002E35E340
MTENRALEEHCEKLRIPSAPPLRAAYCVTWRVDSPGFSLAGEKLRIPSRKARRGFALSAQMKKPATRAGF